MVTKTVDLRGIRDLDILEITVRAVTGEDTVEAAGRCIPPDGSQIDGNMFGMMLRQQCIAQAIISFVGMDGAAVRCQGPCLESVRWNSRTREHVGMIWDYLNGVSEEERETFRKALAPKKSTPGSQDIAAVG